MASDDSSFLWCFVDGSTDPFKIYTLPHWHVDDLKKEIGVSQRLNVASSEIVIWKLNRSTPVIPADTLAQRILREGENISDIASKLEPAAVLSEKYTSQPMRDNLDVFVTISNSRVRPHSPTAEEEDRRPAKRRNIPVVRLWLKEVHSKIWGRRDLREILFTQAEVTVAHYEELQERLNKQNPDRHSPDYSGTKSVQSLKLDILQNFIPPPRQQVSGGSADDNSDQEKSDGDLFELRSFLPSTLRFLDLSSLELENVSSRIPLPLLIREEYDYMSTLIQQRPRSNAGCVIVSGQPGTGKTAFLHLKVIESMIDGQPFLYQAKDGVVYHVADDVTEIVSFPPKESIMAFVDGDGEDYAPKLFLHVPGVQIVMTSSPKRTQHSWLRQGGLDSHVDLLALNLWSPRELYLTGIFLNSQDISFTRLKQSVSHFGFNPRQCFTTAPSAFALRQAKLAVQAGIRSLSQGPMTQYLQPSSMESSHVSHTIFELASTSEDRALGACQIGAASSWTLDLLLQEWADGRADAAADFYHSVMGTPEAGTLRECMFERQVLKHLDAISTQHTFPIRALSTSIVEQWIYPGPADRFTFQSSTFQGALNDAVKDKKPLHLVPSYPNFPAVDSILHDPNQVLTCIKITVRDTHPIDVSGLKQIQGWLKRKSPLESLRPSCEVGKHWRFIFIVPSDIASTFKVQLFNGDTTTQEWGGKVDQYVLGLDEDTLFRR